MGDGTALPAGPRKLQPQPLPGPRESSLCGGHASPHGGGGLHLRRPALVVAAQVAYRRWRIRAIVYIVQKQLLEAVSKSAMFG